MHSIGVVLVTVYTYHTHVCAHVHTSTIQLSILTVCRYRRSIDTDVLGHYRVCIASVSMRFFVCIAAVSNIETSVSNIDEQDSAYGTF